MFTLVSGPAEVGLEERESLFVSLESVLTCFCLSVYDSIYRKQICGPLVYD